MKQTQIYCKNKMLSTSVPLVEEEEEDEEVREENIVLTVVNNETNTDE
jgi:hypothetical protein